MVSNHWTFDFEELSIEGWPDEVRRVQWKLDATKECPCAVDGRYYDQIFEPGGKRMMFYVFATNRRGFEMCLPYDGDPSPSLIEKHIDCARKTAFDIIKYRTEKGEW